MANVDRKSSIQQNSSENSTGDSLLSEGFDYAIFEGSDLLDMIKVI